MFIKPERTEAVKFKLTCDHELTKKFRDRLIKLKILRTDFPETRLNDTFYLDYELWIHYFGNVAEVLELFIEMIDAGAVKTGDLFRIDEGEILIKRILESLQRIKK